MYWNNLKTFKARGVSALLVVVLLNFTLYPLTTSADAVVETGDAISAVDVLNEADTSSINSDVNIITGSDALGGENLDLREIIEAPTENASTTETTDAADQTSTSTCENCIVDYDVENQNTATVTNNMIVSTATGSNEASSTQEVVIETGDAYAAGNVVNIANTNIVDSDYVLVVFNNFGDYYGDLVLPGGDFFANFFSLISGNPPQITENNNDASITNDVNVSANTSQNKAEGNNTSIETGEAQSSTNIYNIANQNIQGGSSFHLLIKVSGDWDGDIFNLPPGLVWEETPQGIVLSSDGGSSGNNSTPQTISNNNEATIENNITVSANTGKNIAEGRGATIKTGNAYAVANVVNIVNTNIISSNWIMALINILGNWKGNISFGQPDLWVATRAETQGQLEPNSLVKFTVTVKNNGDANASNIKISLEPESNLIIHGPLERNLGSLAPGKTTQFTYEGILKGDLPYGHAPIKNMTRLSLHETDGNIADNTDLLTLISYREPTVMLPHTSRTYTYPDIEVAQRHNLPSSIIINGSEPMAPVMGEINHEVIIKNNGGLAHEGVLVSLLKNEKGEIVGEYTWDLGEILPNEEIKINYTSILGEKMLSGRYTNETWVEAVGGDYEAYDGAFSELVKSNLSEGDFIIAPKPVLPEITLTDVSF